MDSNVSLFPTHFTHASDTQHSAESLRSVPVGKSISVSEGSASLSEIWTAFDAIIADFLSRYADQEAARLSCATPMMVRHWRRLISGHETGTRPKAGNFLAMCINDSRCLAMLMDLIGHSGGLHPNELAAFLSLKAAIRASDASPDQLNLAFPAGSG